MNPIEPFGTTAICLAVADRGLTVADVDWATVRMHNFTHDYIDLAFDWRIDWPSTIVPISIEPSKEGWSH